MSDLPPTWMERLRKLRALSRRNLAEFAGVTRRAVWVAEVEGQATPDVLTKVADVLGVDAKHRHRLLDRDQPRAPLRVVRGDLK